MTTRLALPDLPGLGAGAVVILLGTGVLLAIITLFRGVEVLRSPNDSKVRYRWYSVVTWWVLLMLFAGVLIVGRTGVVVASCVLSLLLLREALSLADALGALPAASAVTLAVYGWAWLDWSSLFLGAQPVLLGTVLVGEVMRRGPLGPRIERLTAVGRAFSLAVLGPSFVVATASLPAAPEVSGGEMGWLVLLVVLTALNDSVQAMWGQVLGSRQLAPRISPGKTWEGFLGGGVTVALASTVVAPLVTPFGRIAPWEHGPVWVWSAGVGLLIWLAATAGDLLASVEKRRAGVKDSGEALPGHGGFLDRMDSLAVSAPAFFFACYVTWLAGS